METVNENFINFLIKAKLSGYASGGESNVKVKEKDGSKTISYSEGEYKYHDNYFGGEPYGGREVIFINNKPIWMMVYYGKIIKGDRREIYSFLQKALRTIPQIAPYRGDREVRDENFKYENTWNGNIENFSGTETILFKEKKIYEASYLGGMVDVDGRV